jgi:hypothetical protein
VDGFGCAWVRGRNGLGLVRRVDRRRAFGWGCKDELQCKGLAGVRICSRIFLSFVCVCVCVYAGVQVYVYVYLRVCMCAWVCVCMCTCCHEYYLVGPCVDVFICIPTTSREWESVREMERERERVFALE